MFYKRPSLRRGGMPTGIETIAPRKNYNIAGIVSPEMASEYARGQGTNLNRTPFIGGKSIYSKPIGPTRTPFQARFPLFSSATSAMSLPSFSTMATLAAPFVPTGIMAYANRPKTLEEKKVMQEYGPIDETFFLYDEYDADRKKARETGEEISFLDALLMDPETGTYPKGFGRTKDREKIKEIEQAEEAKEDFEMPKGGGADFAEIAAKVVPNKGDKGDADKSKDTQPGGETEEYSFDSEYDKQMKRLEKYLGTDNRETKGKLALALSDAIGTEGTIADKASALNKSLLGILGERKKDKRELAKIAFAATTELEKARITAGKKGFQERNFNEYANLASKTNRTPAEEKRFEILKDGLGIKTGMTGQTAKAAQTIADDLRKDIFNLSEAAENEKAGIQADIIGKINGLLLIQGVTKDNISGIVGYDVSAYLADGGRVNKAMGGGASETPAEPVATNLTFEQLRTRLPKEITDDIVKLVATSEEALQDFAYIRTQGDVEKFNVKYGVNLVLPQETA